LKKIKLPFKIRLLFSPRERKQQIVGAGPRLISYHASAYITSGEVIKVYNTGYENMATVYIVDEGGRGMYIVDEPKVPEEIKNVYGLIMEHLSYSLKPAEVFNIEDYVKNLVWEAAEELGIIDIVEQHIKTLNYYIMRDVIGYGYIDVPMRDPLVEEISMEGPRVPVAVVHREVTKYTWIDTNIVIPTEEEAAVFVQKLAQKCGKYISTAFPILEARSPEGHRTALILEEVSGRGSSFTIRKFPEKPLTITKLIDYGTLSPLMAAYFWILLENLSFILIIGGLASGKSIAPYTRVAVRHKGRVLTGSVSELWRLMAKKHGVIEVNSYEYIVSKGLEVASLDPFSLRAVWSPAIMIRHRYRGPLYRVKLGNGYSVDVTPDHSLLVAFSPGDIRVARPEELVFHDHLKAPLLPDYHLRGLEYHPLVMFSRIEKIEEIGDFEGYVYDFEVPGNENFLANNIFVHNTTALQALLTLGPPDFKYVTIEDTPELRLPHTHWHPLYTRRGYTIGSSQLDIDLFELTKLSLRLRGQYIVIGEVRGREIQTLVQAAATGQGSLCSFHANSIEEAFMRMTSPPLDVKPAFLMLIWAVVLMRRVRLRDGRVVRRMAKVWEITGLDIEANKPIPLNYTEVFSWDPFTDSFKPDTPEEVISRSYRLKQVAEANGLTLEELTEELKQREKYIRKMLKEQVFEYDKVSKWLYEYYKRRYTHKT